HDRGVTDRVQSHLPAERGRGIHELLQLCIGEAALAAETRQALVVDERPRSRAREPAIDRGLADGSDADLLISVTGVMWISAQPLRARIRNVQGSAWQIVLVCQRLHAP